jgi:hypothetical protein
MTQIRLCWPITAQLVSTHSRDDIPVELIYDDGDPWAVAFDFGPGTRWLVARDLVMAGLDRPTGIGDVRIWPTPRDVGVLCVHLRAPTGEALIEVPYTTMAQFLAATTQLVPVGSERMDFTQDELTDDC